MARKFGKINKMSERFDDYNYMILGQGGIGKTTFAYEFGKIARNNNEGTFIITFGAENKPLHIPNVFSDVAPNFRVFIEMVDDLTTNREDYGNTQFVAIDSIDEMYRLAEDYVVREYNSSVDADKRVKSIKQVYGGFQAGENRAIDLVIREISRLDEAGYRMIYIGHTKTKAKTDPVTGISYEQYTCSVDNKYYLALKDKVNLVVTGYFEKDFGNLKKKDNPFTKEKQSITTGELIGQRRVMTLVDDDNAIDTKSHFEYIVPKIPFSAKNLVDAVNAAIQKKLNTPMDLHNTEPLPTDEAQELDQMREAVRAKYKLCDNEKKGLVHNYLDQNGLKVDEANAHQLEEIMKIIND